MVIVVAVLWVIVAIAQLLARAWTLPVTALSIAADLLAVATAAAVLVHRPYFTAEFVSRLPEGNDGDLGRALDSGIGISAIAVMLIRAAGIVTAARKYLAHRRE
ncbi:hypothetical protein [Nocardia gamkensis]|uniref:hypothetical protein n=1 Tax=Nocardia gamkensis TaxID=352869 RepID=UPI0037CC1D20